MDMLDEKVAIEGSDYVPWASIFSDVGVDINDIKKRFNNGPYGKTVDQGYIPTRLDNLFGIGHQGIGAPEMLLKRIFGDKHASRVVQVEDKIYDENGKLIPMNKNQDYYPVLTDDELNVVRNAHAKPDFIYATKDKTTGEEVFHMMDYK